MNSEKRNNPIVVRPTSARLNPHANVSLHGAAFDNQGIGSSKIGRIRSFGTEHGKSSPSSDCKQKIVGGVRKI